MAGKEVIGLSRLGYFCICWVQATEMWRKYFDAVHIYITLLICRVGTYFGVDMSEELSSLYESAEKLKSKLYNTADAKKSRA